MKIMSAGRLVSTDEIREKLMNIEEYMPQLPNVVVEFANYLADHLNPKLVPAGFALSYAYGIVSLYRGKHGNGQPIHHKLAKMPRGEYIKIKNYFDEIVDVVAEPEFASEAKKEFQTLQEDIDRGLGLYL